MAKQWHNVCAEDTNVDFNNASHSQSMLGVSSGIFNYGTGNLSKKMNGTQTTSSKFSANAFLKAMVHEQRHGNDIYLSKIWQKFHPEQNFTLSQQRHLRFTFPEFVRFIVNGSIEFAKDKYVINHKGLSYHWSPYWKECEVCSNITMPHFIIHLDTLKQDLTLLINYIQGDSTSINLVDTFPHTHRAERYNPNKIERERIQKSREYFSALTRSDIENLYDKYKLDHVLFGYTLDEFLQYVKN